ncbi:unnamed protein product [Thlaspi arvense]|uniref:WRKY domain-containing protein n=1 Tax=Thlaspi arvense TaxID=13288 RepID=A0AAU9RQA0_THLAR|nr:unnamed protein product [Thlaspi arvense]
MFPEIDHKAVAALLRGQGCANSLKMLLENREIGSVSVGTLINTILDSFSLALSFVDSPNPPQNYESSSSQNMPRLVSRSPFKKSSIVLDVSIRAIHALTIARIQHCRKICGVEVIEKYRDDSPTPLLEDGFVWRKYGQKNIKTSPHQRCYYRCTYAKDQNCNATKRVQKIKDNPPVYRTTYVGQHTCEALSYAVSLNNDDTHCFKMIQFEKCNHVMSESVMPQLPSINHQEITMEDKATDHMMNLEFDNNEFLVDDDKIWDYDFSSLSSTDLMFFDNIAASD